MNIFDHVKALNPNEVVLPSADNATEIDLDKVMIMIGSVIDIALKIGVMVGLIMIMYSSILYVSSFGDESKAETAKKTLLWSLIGTAVTALANFLVNLLKGYL